MWRPDGEHAGILLLQPGDKDGLLFRLDSENRQALWWQWQDGRSADTIVSFPYQKPLLAQVKSLLRQVIATFFGAVTIAFLTTIVGRVSRPAFQLSAFNHHLPAGRLSLVQHCLPLSVTLLIVLAIIGRSLWIAVNVLERIPHVQDSITYLFQAQTVARGALWAPLPSVPEAFVQEFLTVWRSK